MKRIARVAAVLLVAVSATACGGDDDDDGDASAVTTTTEAASTPNGSAATLTLVAAEVKFDRASLTARADQPLTITLTNNDTIEHNLTIEDLDIDEDVDGGGSVTSDTVTPATGTYEYHCEYHPAAMTGTLIVS